MAGEVGFKLPGIYNKNNQVEVPLTSAPNLVVANTQITGVTLSTGSSVSGTNTGDQTITLSGDVTGSGASSIAAVLATVNGNVGTFQGITVNGKGLVTAASNQSYLTTNQTITFSGDLTGSGTTSITGTLASVNANIGAFTNANITVNAKGLITAASSGSTSSSAYGKDTYAYSFAGGL